VIKLLSTRCAECPGGIRVGTIEVLKISVQ